MLVVPIASTSFNAFNAEASGYVSHRSTDPIGFPTSIDELAEMAGRNCYQSWNRPNQATATNKGYLGNILNQGHFSVLEHASVTFYVEGVSRSLLTELERHRFLSFSVISQRYVRMNPEDAVMPSIIAEFGLKHDNWISEVLFEESIADSFNVYNKIIDQLTEAGVPRKKALEAARSVLPNATEVKMVVTGNIRAWRDVIGKRHSVYADAEIQEFAAEILRHLRVYAPNSVSDISDEPSA